MDISGVGSATTTQNFKTDPELSLKTPTSTKDKEDLKLTPRDFSEGLVLRLKPGGNDKEGKKRTALTESLTDSLSFIRDNFGVSTANASTALINEALKDKEIISEEDLGEGLLSVIRLIDGKYGISAGDRVMSQFNGELNDALNNFFENGLTEKFYAAGSSTPVSDLLPEVYEEVAKVFDEDTANGLAEIMRASLDQKLSPKSFREGLVKAAEYIGKVHGNAAAEAFSDFAGKILGKLNNVVREPLSPGLMLNMII